MRLLLRNSIAYWRRVPERMAPAVFGIPQRREFPGEETVKLLLRRYSKYTEHLRKPVFFCCSGGIHAAHHVGVMSGAFFYQSCLTGDHVPQNFELTLNKSIKVPLHLLSMFYFPRSKIEYRRSKNCSVANPPLFVNPGLKCTWTDAILNKFDWKMNFKIKINLKSDLMNFRSI
jgi:hypothetical protein